MGLLALGTPLDWPDTKPLAEHIRSHGITQFLHTWDRWKDSTGSGLLWGDEVSQQLLAILGSSPDLPGWTEEQNGLGAASRQQIEYMVVSCNDADKKAWLSLRQSEILEKLQTVTLDTRLEALKPPGCNTIPTFHPEYGRYMLESTPGSPYSGSPKDLASVEADMRFRRRIIRSHLNENELPITLTSWPRLGATDSSFTDPPTEADPEHSSSRSQYVGQLLTNPHARFPTLTANIRQRRGSLVDIRVPLYIDKNTVLPHASEAQLSNGHAGPAKPEPGTPYIHMDAMAFGMGCCCLQITFQAWNVDEARKVYDALVPVAPIMLALTAASPAFRGQLADVDARWNVIAASVDDRTEEERGLKPLKNDRYRIPKSRYDSVDLYISNDPRNKPEYHDIPVPMDESVRQRLLDHGLDDKLASHIAHLFIRDPLVQFSETIDQDDEESMDHFENIQSTNWQTIRFKPPPVNSPIGWRVEFRSMEVQWTDFENAAFSIFIVLLTRAIISFDLNFYMPISKVDLNMQKAQERDAAVQNKFAFRRNIFPQDRPHSPWDLTSRPVSTSPSTRSPSSCYLTHEDGSDTARSATPTVEIGDCELSEMTIDEVINGRGEFPGLMGVVNAYLNSLNVDICTKCQLRRYLDLIKLRAKGDLQTPAAWIRQFITSHPAYKHDSVVSDEINYDLVKAIDEIERGVRVCPEVLGRDYEGSGTGCL